MTNEEIESKAKEALPVEISPASLHDTDTNPTPDELRHQISVAETSLRAAHEELKTRFETLIAHFPNLSHL